MTSIVSSPAIVPAISYRDVLSIYIAVLFAFPGRVLMTSRPFANYAKNSGKHLQSPVSGLYINNVFRQGIFITSFTIGNSTGSKLFKDP